MITRAKFQNFKALKDAEITFDERLTVIVGPNGSGKSSILKGIYWMSQVGGMKTFDTGKDNILAALSTTYNGENEIQVVEVCGSKNLKLQFCSHPTNILADHGLGGPLPQNWACKVISVNGGEIVSHQVPQNDFDFQPAELIQLNASRLAAPSSTKTTHPPLSANESSDTGCLRIAVRLRRLLTLHRSHNRGSRPRLGGGEPRCGESLRWQ